MYSKMGLGVALGACWLHLALSSGARAPQSLPAHHEMLARFEGKALTPLAPDPVYARFSKGSALQHYSMGESELMLRIVREPTRSLHPAADCYRGRGYQISDHRLTHFSQNSPVWRCFTAAKGSLQIQVCERIESLTDGTSFTDASSWFWAAALGKSVGPWRAITRATPHNRA